jgi:hypothetical protein
MGGIRGAEVLRSWRGLYKVALFETGGGKLLSRIEEAWRALVVSRSIKTSLFLASPKSNFPLREETPPRRRAAKSREQAVRCKFQSKHTVDRLNPQPVGFAALTSKFSGGQSSFLSQGGLLPVSPYPRDRCQWLIPFNGRDRE